jgi:hypothetical protein
MTLDDLVTQAIKIKETGYSSKIMVPIHVLLEIARDAKQWQAMPETLKEAAKFSRAGQ